MNEQSKMRAKLNKKIMKLLVPTITAKLGKVRKHAVDLVKCMSLIETFLQNTHET